MQRLGAYLFVLLLTLFPRAATGQIVNRLQVDDATFQRYAWGRMQQYNPANLALADSLYPAGEAADDYRYKILSKVDEADAMDLYLDFRGRMPEVGPFLEDRGLK